MKNKILSGLAILSAMMFAGCDVTEPIYDTAHSTMGRITITTDWTDIGTGITAPASYTVKIGEHSAVLTNPTHIISELFAPGTYHINIFSTADKITVNGNMAIVTPLDLVGQSIDPMPGWFFTWSGDQTIENDKEYDITAVMQQQVRELNLVIDPTGGTADKIAGISATLSGVAGTLNIDNGTVTGNAVSVAPIFSKQSDGKYKATVRLLGITGNSQKLNITLSYTGGSAADQPQEYDLTTLLTAFNNDKKTPLTLGAQAVETPTGSGFTCTITDWAVEENRTGNATIPTGLPR